MRLSIPTALTATLVAGLLVGCGSNDDTNTTKTKAPAKAPASTTTQQDPSYYNDPRLTAPSYPPADVSMVRAFSSYQGRRCRYGDGYSNYVAYSWRLKPLKVRDTTTSRDAQGRLVDAAWDTGSGSVVKIGSTFKNQSSVPVVVAFWCPE
jgi:hypothetical protein